MYSITKVIIINSYIITEIKYYLKLVTATDLPHLENDKTHIRLLTHHTHTHTHCIYIGTFISFVQKVKFSKSLHI